MVAINWTAQAIQDIENIASYIAQDSEKYAKIQARIFFQRAQILETLPEVGRVLPEIGDNNIRELLTGSYRIIYKIVDPARIDILTVYHSKRLLHLRLFEVEE